MEVVACVAKPDAPPVTEGFAALGSSVGTDALQEPEVGDVREPHFAVEGKNTAGDAVEHGVKPIRENAGFICFSGALGVFNQSNDFGFALEGLPVVGKVLFGIGDAVFHASRRHIILEHKHIMPDIEDARAVAVGFGGEAAALIVKGEGDRITEERFACPGFTEEAWPELEGFPPLVVLTFGFSEEGFAGSGSLLERICLWAGSVDVCRLGGKDAAGRKGQDRGGAFHGEVGKHEAHLS